MDYIEEDHLAGHRIYYAGMEFITDDGGGQGKALRRVISKSLEDNKAHLFPVLHTGGYATILVSGFTPLVIEDIQAKLP